MQAPWSGQIFKIRGTPSPPACPTWPSLFSPVTNTTKITKITKITKFDVKTGLMTGSFQDGTRLAPWNGLLVKIGGVTKGYGYFLQPTGVPDVPKSPKLSGKVVLGVP